MQISRFSIPILTDASGNAAAFSPNFSGEILAAHVIVPGSGGISGATLALTSEATGESVLSVSSLSSTAHYYPRGPVHTVAGVAQLYASAGLPVTDRIGLAEDRVEIAVSSGGNTKAATVILVVAGD